MAPPLAAKVGVLDGVGLRHYTAKVSSSSGVDELVAATHGLEHGVDSKCVWHVQPSACHWPEQKLD